jgi:hypothetical protein
LRCNLVQRFSSKYPVLYLSTPYCSYEIFVIRHNSRTLAASLDVPINPLNAELNPICHLLVLLGELTFMGRCMVSIFQYISNKMQRYTVYLYLETALHVSGGTSTHHQGRIQLYSIWYLSHRYCYLLLSWRSWNRFECAVGGIQCNVASCWIYEYIGILLGVHYILHISRI